MVFLGELGVGLVWITAALIFFELNKRYQKELGVQLSNREVHELASHISLVRQGNVNNFLLPIDYEELIRVCLESNTWSTHIIGRDEVCNFFPEYVVSILDQLLAGNVRFCLEGYDERFRTGFSNLSDDLGSCVQLEGHRWFFPSLDLARASVLRLVIAGSTGREDDIVPSLFQLFERD